MVLKSIVIKNFRLHKNLKLEFSDKLNYIVGGNGIGKTSVLEAIYYLCTSKNFNTIYDSESVSFGEEFFEIEGYFKGAANSTVRVIFTRLQNKKSFIENNKNIFRISKIIGRYPVVTLTPSDHNITQGYPADRRKFVDSVISQSSSAYLDYLLEYGRILKHRTALLLRIRESENADLMDQLEVWTEKLVQTGSEIIERRIKFIERFYACLEKAYLMIVGNKDKPSLEYMPFNERDTGNIRETFLRKIKTRKKEEIRRSVNLVGPHRDDFLFKINDRELKKFGSQGENKSFQVALRFAQFFFMKEELGSEPIFLMDDIFGELDSYRAGMISTSLSDLGQSFITMTDLADSSRLKISENDKTIYLSDLKTLYVQRI